jgi:two-component system, chemotaxis family, sensor kinase Cph1
MLDAGQPLVLEPAELAGLVPCDGMALVARARVERFGHAPDPPDIRTLAGWLEAPLRRGVYATGHLARELPSAAHYAVEGSGVLAIAVDCPEPVVLMWFRVGERSRVAPPGNPREAEAPAAGESSPRTSAARPWTRAETGTISRFGRSLASLVQQQTLRDLNGRLRDALAEQRTLVAQKNLLMMEVHHRVQNSLQIVNSMLQLQARQTHDVQVRGQFQSAVNRLMAVSAVHRHLWQSSDAQNVHLGPYLRELCTDLTRSWGEGWSGHVAVTGGEVVIPSHMAVTLALLITELLTNAAKYAYGGAPGPVTVQVLEADGGALQVSVADHGRGMQAEVQGSGLGSKLIRIFTSQLGGRVDTRTGAAGTKVTIVVPLMHRHGAEPTGSVNGARA